MDAAKVYVNASVVLRKILNQPGSIRHWSGWERVVSSELMPVEAFRTLDRLHLERRLSDSELAACLVELKAYTAAVEQVPLSPDVLKRAATHLPTPIGTLDAIHLVSALMWIEANSEPLTFVTHDRQLSVAARVCGLEVLGA